MFQLPEIHGAAGDLANVEGWAKKWGVWAKNGGVGAKSEKVSKECIFVGKGVISLGKEKLMISWKARGHSDSESVLAADYLTGRAQQAAAEVGLT